MSSSASELSELAMALLRDMASAPNRVEYNTRVLGGSFRDADVARLDEAYSQLEQKGLIQRAGVVVSFFGSPKPLYRITDGGKQRAGAAA